MALRIHIVRLLSSSRQNRLEHLPSKQREQCQVVPARAPSRPTAERGRTRNRAGLSGWLKLGQHHSAIGAIKGYSKSCFGDFTANGEGANSRPSRACPGRLDRYRETLRQLLASHGAEAVAAVHRPVAPRQERHLGVNATLGAHRRMHLPLPTAITAAAAAAVPSLLASAGPPASLAAAWFIGETLGSKKFLFAGCEDENCPTVSTCQVFV